MKLISVLLVITVVVYAGMAWGQDCLVDTTEVSFGIYDTFSKAPLDATGRVTVVCDGAFRFSVKLDKGQNSLGSFNPRVMRAAGAEVGLNYNLFTNSARQIIWGDDTGNTRMSTGAADRVQAPLTVYGRIPAGQRIPAGNYTDRINVTVEW